MRLFDECFDLSVLDRTFEYGVVLFVLVGVDHREGTMPCRTRRSAQIPLITAGSPERAWESASEWPHQSAKMVISAVPNVSTAGLI